MTYCVALNLDSGIVMLSDSRLNAGIDYIISSSKVKTWKFEASGNSKKDKVFIAILSAGNLATTQKVIATFDKYLNASVKKVFTTSGDTQEFLYLDDIATGLGKIVKQTIADAYENVRHEINFDASLIMAAKIGSDNHRLFLIYPQGNYMESTPETPYMQLGESKYGKPILDQVITRASSLSDGVQATLISMDITSRANLSVGPPFDLVILDAKRNTWITRRIKDDDSRYAALIRDWNEGMRMLFARLPEAVNIDETLSVEVFISYSNKDKEYAIAIVKFLEDLGITTWWDYELLGGENFRQEIVAKLDAAHTVLVLWTENSVSSDFVIDEADRAKKQSKLIPLRHPDLPESKIPLGFGQIQTIQFDDHETIKRSLAALGVGASIVEM